MAAKPDIDGLPGSEIIISGLADLAESRVTEASLLVLIAGPNLRRHGIDVAEIGVDGVGESADVDPPYEHRLYDLLVAEHGRSAYSRYNSLIRRLVSFEHALAARSRSNAAQ
jgi:hypothetical protein